MTQLYHRVHHKMHVNGLAKKSAFELDISGTEGHFAKILSPIDSTHQNKNKDNHNTAVTTNFVFWPINEVGENCPLVKP